MEYLISKWKMEDGLRNFGKESTKQLRISNLLSKRILNKMGAQGQVEAEDSSL
jgi:hypothetical protein